MNHLVVLHTRVNAGAGGGIDKTIVNSPRYLREFGFQGYCAYFRSPNNTAFATLQDRAAQAQATLFAIDDRGPLDPFVVIRAWRLCRRLKVRIWHAHEYKSNLLGLLLRPVHPMRLVTTAHGWVDLRGRTPLYYALDRRCIKYYERVIAVSDDLRTACQQAGVPKSRLVQIDNAIDCEQYQKRRAPLDARRQLGISADAFVIGAMGRLSEEKGFHHLINAVDSLCREFPRLQLVIAGDGPQRKELASLIAHVGRSHQVRLLGYCEDTIPFFESLDLFVSSSLREGMPNVILEAMAMQLPIVATRIAGVPRLIEHDRDGLLVSADSADALAQAMSSLIPDGERRNRLGIAARERVLLEFSFRDRMLRVANVYRELEQDVR